MKPKRLAGREYLQPRLLCTVFQSLTKLCLELGTNPNGDYCKYCPTPLAIAVDGGHTSVVALLLQQGASTISNINTNEAGALHLAAAHGTLKIFQLLLMYGAEIDTTGCGTKRSILHIAAEYGHLALVKLLMECNVDINARIPKTLETPLHLAAAQGHLQVMKCLVGGGDASAREVSLYNSILKQPYYESWIECLFPANGKAGNISWEASRYSAERDLREFVSCSRSCADISMRTHEGFTTLHLAALNGHEMTVRFLLESGATVQGVTNTQCTALQLAAENGHVRIVRRLLEAGADVNAGVDKIGTILERLGDSGHHTIANLLLWQSFCVEITGDTCHWPLHPTAAKSTTTALQHAIRKNRDQRRTTTRARSRLPLQHRDMQACFVAERSTGRSKH